MRFNGSAGAAALEARGITISAAARKLRECGHDIERSHLSNILSGRRGAGIEMVQAFATLTGEDPMVFVGPEDPRDAVLRLCRVYKITAKDLKATA